MKLLPCVRKMSATSTVGRLTLFFWVADSGLRRALKWEERRWGCSQTANDVERGGGRWSLLPNRNDRATSGLSSDRSRAPTGVLPRHDAANAETLFSGSLRVEQLHA